MGSAARSHAAPRPRPVADAPVEALVARADELARRWAIALILARPLDRLGELPFESFAREAPALCAQLVRALSSDEQLERLCGRSPRDPGAAPAALRLAEVTGARDSTAVVEAMEALRGVVWDALADEVGLNSADRSAARELGDLADRLAYVCSSAVACSLAAPAPPVQRRFATRAPNGAPATAPAEAEVAPLAPSAPAPQPSLALADGVRIVDEAPAPPRRRWPDVDRAPAPAAGERATAAYSPRSGHPRLPAESLRRAVRARPLPWDPPLRSRPAWPQDD